LLPGINQEESMRKSLVVLSFAAGLGLACSQNAIAAPADATALKQAAMAASPIEKAQYEERHTRHGMVKCYRDLVIGPYRCHHFRNGQFNIGL
jgi:hypothetical protein